MSVKLTRQLSFPLSDSLAATIQAVPDNPNAQMFLTVFNTANYGSLTIKRVLNSVEMDVRGATNIAVEGADTILVTDYECPLDVTVTYRAYLDGNEPLESSPAIITTDGRTFWLKDVILGAFSTKVNIESMSDVSRPSVILGTFHVLNRKNPIIITDVRGGRTGTMVLTAYTTGDNIALSNIIDSGNTLLLQCPLSANFPDMYFQAGDVSESWNGGLANNVIHSFTIPFTETDPPSQSAISLDFNSWLLVTQFGTWTNVLAKRALWTDVFTTPFTESDAP